LFFIPYIEILFSIIFGACLGSFATAVTHRELIGQVWWALRDAKKNKHSECPQCKTTLKFLDLIPIFSWLFLIGKCRHCKSAISPFYFYVECLHALIAAILYTIYGFEIITIFLFFLMPFVFAFCFVLFKQKRVSLRLLLIILAILCMVIGGVIL